MEQESSNGLWQLGGVYRVPSNDSPGGSCETTHMVEVLNPSLTIHKTVTRERVILDRIEVEEITGPIECVLVRCMDCLMSWSVPAIVEIGEPERESLKRVFDWMMAEKEKRDESEE